MQVLDHEAWLRPAFRVRAFSAMTMLALTVLIVLVLVVPAGRNGDLEPYGEQLAAIDAGDTAWSMMATALVLLMIPGVSFFYGGMVKRTNLNTTLSQSFATMSLILILWIVVGFSLAFGESVLGGVVGNPATYYFYKGVGAAPDPDLAPTIPLTVFSLFEAAFAVLAPALIAGAVVDRAHFSALLLFCGVWHLVVYCPLAHCTWAPGGLFRKFGHLDFAGGTVIHMASGFSALTLARMVGYKSVHPDEKAPKPHIPYVMLGTTLMWLGWQGFNGGSALEASYISAQAILNTNVSAATCLAYWGLWDNVQGRRVTGISLSGGIICGLVAITPAAGYVTVGGAMFIGGICGMVSNAFIRYFRSRRIVDDTLDVFGCHGVAGLCGMILTACFATDAVNPEVGYNGLVYGSGQLLWRTLLVALGTIAYCTTMTAVAFYAVDLVIPFRVSLKQEQEGLDSSLHESVHGTLNTFLHAMLHPSMRQHSSREGSTHAGLERGLGGYQHRDFVHDLASPALDSKSPTALAPHADITAARSSNSDLARSSSLGLAGLASATSSLEVGSALEVPPATATVGNGGSFMEYSSSLPPFSSTAAGHQSGGGSSYLGSTGGGAASELVHRGGGGGSPSVPTPTRNPVRGSFRDV